MLLLWMKSSLDRFLWPKPSVSSGRGSRTTPEWFSLLLCMLVGLCVEALSSKKCCDFYTKKRNIYTPRYNQPQYSEFRDIVNKIQLPFWGFTQVHHRKVREQIYFEKSNLQLRCICPWLMLGLMAGNSKPKFRRVPCHERLWEIQLDMLRPELPIVCAKVHIGATFNGMWRFLIHYFTT